MDASKLIDSTCGNADNNCNVLWDKSQTTVMILTELADGLMGRWATPPILKLSRAFATSPCGALHVMNYNYNNAHQVYFGSSEGVFHIIPAHHMKHVAV
ncbi:hypothetical protein ACHAW6_010876 [Cyclotella cf. meneghiniana]